MSIPTDSPERRDDMTQPARATAATGDNTERTAGEERMKLEGVKPEELFGSIVTGLHQIEVIDGLRRGGTQLLAPPARPSEAIEWMNTRHFVVREAGKTVVVTEERDPALKRRVLKRSSFEDIRNFYCNQFVDAVDAKGKPAKKPLGSHWLNDPRRRQYDGIVCAPNGQAPGYYNLWQGFSVLPRPGD